MKASSLFRDIPHTLPQESVNILAQSSNVKIERIVSRGHASPHNGWYEQSKMNLSCWWKDRLKLRLNHPLPASKKGIT